MHDGNVNVKQFNQKLTDLLNDPSSMFLTQRFLDMALQLNVYQTNIKKSKTYDPEEPLWRNTVHAIMEKIKN